MNLIENFLEKLTDNSCNNSLITVTIVLSISVVSCFITCAIIKYLMCKRKHEYEIERQIFTSEKFYNVDKKLASIESELKEIKDLVNKK